MNELTLTDDEKQRIYALRQRLVFELLPLVKKVESISQELLNIMNEAKARSTRTQCTMNALRRPSLN